MRIVVSFLLALLIATPAAALDLPPAVFKAPPKGTELLWGKEGATDQSLIRVKGRDGKWLEWERGDGEQRAGYTLFCWWCPPEAEFDTAALDSLWPLEVGNEATYERRSGSNAWSDTVKVLRTDTVSVPAGRFDVFVIETTSYSLHGWNGKLISYYAPGLGWTVRIERSTSDSPDQTWHVLSIDGRSGIQASVTAPSDADARAERTAAFARQPAPEEVKLVPIGEVTGVKTFAYGTVPGDDREGRYVRDTLTSNELLETISGSALHAKFEDGTVFRMGASAQARLDRFVYDPDKGAGEMAMSLGKGAFRFISGAVKAGTRIGTPDVTIGVRGTDFIVEVTDDDTVVTALEGEVEVTPRNGGGGVSVSAGQTATATAQDAAVASAAPDALAVPPALSATGCGG